MPNLPSANDIAIAQLPDGRHIIYVQGFDDDRESDGIAYKIVGSTIDLQEGGWQFIPLDIKKK